MNDKKYRRIPKVGDDIYVPTSLYLSHGVDDVVGGLATVVKVEREKDYIWVMVAEHQGNRYNWKYLERDQEKHKKRYGNERAYPDPDYDPSANTWL